MPELVQIKDQLIDDLWLPVAKEGGTILHPRLRKNKEMKFLTLTDDRNFREIETFVENDLTTRDSTIAWSSSYIKKLRLETELSPARVLGPARYEDSISNVASPLGGCFPFEIVNLDFSSQEPDLESGRLEREVHCVEETLVLQKSESIEGFVLMYTTMLNSHALNYRNMIDMSDGIHVDEWPGLPLGDLSPLIEDRDEKARCLEYVVTNLRLKHGFQTEPDIRCLSIGDDDECILSIVGLLKRR